MKHTLKKVLALALAACTVFGLLVPAVFAGETTETPDVVYDFMQYDTGDSRASLASKIEDLNTRYTDANDPLNWKFEKASGTVVDANGIPKDPNVSFTIPQYFRIMSTQGDWFAIRIKSPGAGDYKLSLNLALFSNGAKESNVYILPGETTDIADGMTEDTLVGTVSYYSDAEGYTLSKASVGTWTFEADKEYIVVLDATAKQVRAYMYLAQIELYKAAGDTYQFFRSEYTTKNGLNARKEEIDQRYAEGDLNWKYEASGDKSVADAVAGTAAATNAMFDAGSESLQLRTAVGGWVAFRVRVAEAAKYELNYTHAQHIYGAKASVHILPAKEETMTVDEINAALAQAHWSDAEVSYYYEAGSTSDPTQKGVNTNLGVWTCESAGEYIIVLKADAVGAKYARQFPGALVMKEAEEASDGDDELTADMLNAISLGEPIVTFGMNMFAASGEVNGHDYYYAPIKGGKLYVYDLDMQKKVDVEDTGISAPRGAVVDSNGMLYISGDASHIFQYNPYTGIGEKLTLKGLSSEATNLFAITVDDQDNLYFGTSPDAKVFKCDPKTGECSDYGVLDADATYAISVAYHDGFVYAEVYGDANGDTQMVKKLLKINAQTKEIVKTLSIAEKLGSLNGVHCLDVVGGDTLVAGGSSLKNMIAVDLESFEFIDIGIASGSAGMFSEVRNGKAYFVAIDTGLCEYDIATRKATLIEAFKGQGIPLRFTTNSFVTIEGDPDLPGESLFTCSASGPAVFYNLQTGVTKKWTDITTGDGTGQWIRSFENGPAGSNLIYIGSYHTGTAVGYNTAEQKYTLNYNTGNQTDSQLLYNGKLYAGTYPDATVVEMNLDTYKTTKLFSLKSEFRQARIHTLAAGDGKIFAGTVPDQGLFGGMIAWYDMETKRTYVLAEQDLILYADAAAPSKWYNHATGEAYTFEKNPDGTMVPFEGIAGGLSIQSLVYHNGYLYASTSRWGGSSTAIDNCPKAGATILVYDVKDMKLVGEYDVDIDGIENPDFIAGIAADPNVDTNNKFWGVVSETLFSFNVDPNTGAIIAIKEELSFSKTSYTTGGSRSWFPRPIEFDGSGYMYVGFDSAGGFRKINVNDPKGDNQRIMEDTPMFYALGEDGNLYYAYVYELRMLPLNATDQDKTAAAAVDAMIDAIGTVTLESKTAVTAAREAYEAMPNVQKALVTKLETLTAAEVALAQLEYAAANQAAAKAVDDLINAVGTVTLESKSAITAARAGYDALSNDQKSLVANYAKLTAAESELAKLEAEKEAADKAAADVVNAKINAIGEVKLESEEAIKAAREAFDALTADQKKLVDETKLTAAETKLGELKAAAEKAAADKAAADAVIAQIEAIGKVTLESKEAIAAAREAYEALTAEQKALVTNLNVLTAAEASLAALENPKTGETVSMALVAGILALSAAAIVLAYDIRRKRV